MKWIKSGVKWFRGLEGGYRMMGMTNEQIQKANREDLLTSRFHAVSHLPFDNYFRQCVENEATANYAANTPVHDAEFTNRDNRVLTVSGHVMPGDFLRVVDSFFRVDDVTYSAGGTVLDIDDLEGGAFYSSLAGSEV